MWQVMIDWLKYMIMIALCVLVVHYFGYPPVHNFINEKVKTIINNLKKFWNKER
jgi:F0F1-type ATP synthase membrane subunit b/b'